MTEPTTTALAVRRESEPHPSTIRLPAEMPAPDVTIDEPDPRPSVEQISSQELRLMDEAKDAPRPAKVLETAPMLKPSLVVPVQVNGEMFRDFLDALASVAHEDAAIPILRNVRVTYGDGELLLEANDTRLWALAKLKAIGGRDGFECVLPLKRARNVVRRILASYSTVSIGVDLESIHLGNYSFPHGGAVRDFPQRQPPAPEELRAVMPAHYVDAILGRVAPVVGDDSREQLSGVHIDFNDDDGVAVATDGHRLHLLHLAELRVEAKESYKPRPALTLAPDVFRFLQAVIDREWVGLNVSEKMLTVGGEDYGIVAQPVPGEFPAWRQTVPKHATCWVLDRAALLQLLDDAMPLKASYVRLVVDDLAGKLTLTARGDNDESYERSVTAHRKDGLPSVRIGVNPAYLRDAVRSAEGGLVRLGFANDDTALSPITVRGTDDDFLAVVMPCRMTGRDQPA